MSHLALVRVDPEANEFDDAEDSSLGEGKHMKRRLQIFSSPAGHKISSSILLISAYLCNRQSNKYLPNLQSIPSMHRMNLVIRTERKTSNEDAEVYHPHSKYRSNPVKLNLMVLLEDLIWPTTHCQIPCYVSRGSMLWVAGRSIGLESQGAGAVLSVFPEHSAQAWGQSLKKVIQ